MACAPRQRTKRHASEPEMHVVTQRAPKVMAVHRLADDTVCHSRCGRPLALHGVRGLLEADFYCYGCLAHVTIPLTVLHALPVTATADRTLAGAAL
jgi:hypothetical protein